MVRTSAMYFERLRSVLHKCLRLGLCYGVITIDMLARELGIGERGLRDYLRDLTTMGVIEYLGAGRYRINTDRINSISRYLDGGSLDITDFFDDELIRSIRASREIEDRVSRIFERLNVKKLLDRDFRMEVLNFRYSGVLTIDGARIVGDRLILPGVSESFPLDRMYVGGSGYGYSVDNRVLWSSAREPFATLTLAFTSAASFVAWFEGDRLDYSKSWSDIHPSFREYTGRSPFVRGEPFYELVTGYPELLDFARRLAARLIAQQIHYNVILSAIDSKGSDMDVLFVGGSLFPHGYVIEAKRLLELKSIVEKTFDKLVSMARKYRVLLAGVNFKPHDNVFIRFLRKYLDVEFGHINDTNALLFLLNDGDTTAPINRFSEKGRRRIDEWYEFYMKVGDRVVKVEYISLGEPFKDYVRIRDLLYSSSLPSPRGDDIFGPSPMVESVIRAQSQLRILRHSIPKVIQLKLDEYLGFAR